MALIHHWYHAWRFPIESHGFGDTLCEETPMVDEHIPLARDPFFRVFQKTQKNGSQLVQDLIHNMFANHPWRNSL